jgi:hypothetical protein
MGDGTANLRVCFMVMPFRRRKVEEPKGADAPAELDCDALWDKAFRPAIEQLGYMPIRADYDPGSVIVKDMLERLALADLVLADVSLANGNVYYEVGLRHAAKENRLCPPRCGLVQAAVRHRAVPLGPLPAEGRQRTG